MDMDPHPFEPLLPSDARIEPLLARARDLSRLATPLAERQRLAVAHIKAEEALERRCTGAQALRFLFPRLWPEAEADAANR